MKIPRILLSIATAVGLASESSAQIPEEPIELELGVPQFFVDDWLVDNRFANKYKTEAVVHRVHPPQKHEANPVFPKDGGYVNVARHPENGKFQMWLQTHVMENDKANYAVAYAESEDGIAWTAPKLGLHEWKGTKQNNIVIRGPKNARASGPQLLRSLPDSDHRGHTYLMTYRTGGAGKENDGIRLTTSDDGIHWNVDEEMRLLHIHSDTLNSIVYDPGRERYLMTLRAKDRYRRFSGDIIDTGASRRISMLTSNELWSETAWTESPPIALLTPDEVDAETHHNFFYGMPVQYHAGIYWGYLWVFRMNDPVHTELVTSRDGIHWKRSPHRTPLIGLGDTDTWDDGMVFGGPHWIEVNDEWWFYYAGHDGGHNSKGRKAAIGLATCKKERLISLHGPKNGGGAVITRLLKWPGGDLCLNVLTDDSDEKASVKVRISDAIRDPLPGFDYDDCIPFSGDAIRHRVTWQGKHSLDEMAGKLLRVEISLQNADLFSLTAEPARDD